MNLDCYKVSGVAAAYYASERAEELYRKGVVPFAVIDAINKAFPDNADDILTGLRYHSLDGFWSFLRWGMFVGVEHDGYIHT